MVKIVAADKGRETECELQAVLTKTVYRIDWQELKDSSKWLMGWK